MINLLEDLNIKKNVKKIYSAVFQKDINPNINHIWIYASVFFYFYHHFVFVSSYSRTIQKKRRFRDI